MWVGNEQDFYNLVDVYLDAVFYPRCVNDIHTFQQEGWHYELNDPSEEITFKGKLSLHCLVLTPRCPNLKMESPLCELIVNHSDFQNIFLSFFVVSECRIWVLLSIVTFL